MTDVLNGAIGIEVEQRPLRPLRQRGQSRVPERCSKVMRSPGGGLGRARHLGALFRQVDAADPVEYFREWTVCSRHLTLGTLVRISDAGGAD